MSPKIKRYIMLGIRIIIGAVFLLSGIGKLIDSSDAIYMVELMATKFYWLIEYGNAIVITTSVVELLLAGLLLWGRKLNWVLSASFLMLAFFTGVVSYFYIQGISVGSCGCFGAFGGGGGLTTTLVRNSVLLLLVVGGIVLQTTTVSGEPESEYFSYDS